MFLHEVPFADLKVGQKVLSATRWPGVISEIDRTSKSVSIRWSPQTRVKKVSVSHLTDLADKKPPITLLDE